MKVAIQITILVFVVIGVVLLVWSIFSAFTSGQGGLFGGSEAPSAGILRSEDGAMHWVQTGKIEDGISIDTLDIIDFVPHPEDPNVFFMTTNGQGIFKSSDRGENWSRLKDKNGLLQDTSAVFKLAINNLDSKVFYITVFQNGRSYVFKSTDGGESFIQIYIASTPEERIYAVGIDNVNPNLVYLVTDTGLFLKSFDAGASWNFAGKLRVGVRSLTITPRNDIYAFNLDSTISKSSNQGLTWEDLQLQGISTPAPAAQGGPMPISLFDLFKKKEQPMLAVNFFVIDRNFTNVIYLGSGNQVYKSYDEGKNWSPMNLIVKTEAVNVMAFAQDAANPGTLYVGVGGYVYKSLDNGESWQVYQVADTSKIMKFLVISKDDPNDLFAVYNGGF
jgi:photosystem II stability/assembly factor-like uncharacterized protein